MEENREEQLRLATRDKLKKKTKTSKKKGAKSVGEGIIFSRNVLSGKCKEYRKSKEYRQ